MGLAKRTSIFVAICLCSLTVGIVGKAGAATVADSYRYNYVSLDNAKPPGAQYVEYFKVTDNRRVYGNSESCDAANNCVISIIVYNGGKVTVLHSGAIGYTANESGIVGGSVLSGPDNSIEQAALFEGNTVQLIPRLNNEVASRVVKLTDTGIALVESFDATTQATTNYLFVRGRAIPLNFGSTRVAFLDVNNAGLVSGTYASNPNRAFRYDPRSGVAQVLNPLPTEPDSWGQAINSRGDVLGYSFVGGRLERIGYWHDGVFHTSFVEGTPEFPTVSNRLLWNELGLVVITYTNDNNSYIVPKPGVRLNLADLTTGLPVWTYIVDVNNRGDLLGYGGSSRFNVEHFFLLERK